MAPRAATTRTSASGIRHHIRFADYWYTANAQFTDLKEFTREIARDAGLDLDADAAFQWLGTGGFTVEALGAVSIASYDIRAVKLLTERLGDRVATWELASKNRFFLNLEGAETAYVPQYHEGRIERIKCHVRGDLRLPISGFYKGVVRALKWSPELADLPKNLETIRAASFPYIAPDHWRAFSLQTLEAMISEGWVRAELDPDKPCLKIKNDLMRHEEPKVATTP